MNQLQRQAGDRTLYPTHSPRPKPIHICGHYFIDSECIFCGEFHYDEDDVI